MARPVGRPKNPPKFKDLLSDLIPSSDIFEPKELEMFNGLISLFLSDFDESQLSANDMDDIVSIATNRVLEIRLLKSSKGNSDAQIEASGAVERIRKQTERLKENLVTRRKDRIDPKKYSGLSIVDLAVSFDQEKKEGMISKYADYKAEEESIIMSGALVGNSQDQDADSFDKED